MLSEIDVHIDRYLDQLIVQMWRWDLQIGYVHVKVGQNEGHFGPLGRLAQSIDVEDRA